MFILCHTLDPTYTASVFLFLTYLHLVWASLGASTSLWREVFHSFLGGCFNCLKNYQSFFQDGHAIGLSFQRRESIPVAPTAWPTPVVKHVSLFKIVASYWVVILSVFFLIGWWLLYNVVLAPVTQQHELALSVHNSSPPWPSFPSLTPCHPSRLLQSSRLSSLCYKATSHYLFYTW